MESLGREALPENAMDTVVSTLEAKADDTKMDAIDKLNDFVDQHFPLPKTAQVSIKIFRKFVCLIQVTCIACPAHPSSIGVTKNIF